MHLLCHNWCVLEQYTKSPNFFMPVVKPWSNPVNSNLLKMNKHSIYSNTVSLIKSHPEDKIMS